MGACQGDFCGSRVKTLLAEAAGIPENEVTGPSRDRVNILKTMDAMRKLLDD